MYQSLILLRRLSVVISIHVSFPFRMYLALDTRVYSLACIAQPFYVRIVSNLFEFLT